MVIGLAYMPDLSPTVLQLYLFGPALLLVLLTLYRYRKRFLVFKDLRIGHKSVFIDPVTDLFTTNLIHYSPLPTLGADENGKYTYAITASGFYIPIHKDDPGWRDQKLEVQVAPASGTILQTQLR